MNQKLKVLAKWLIFLAVLVGLFLSAKTSVTRWNEQSEAIQREIAELDANLEVSIREVDRKSLLAAREKLIASRPTLNNLRWDYLCLSAVLYALGLVPSGVLLHLALKSLGQSTRLAVCIASQTLGHIGKYFPGKALVVILRTNALSRFGIPARDGTVCVFIETLIMMAVGGAVSTVIVVWLPVPSWIIGLSLIAAIIASIPTLPPVLSRITAKVCKPKGDTAAEQSIGDEPETAIEIPTPSWGLILAGWSLSVLTWIFFGLSFACVIQAIPSPVELPEGAKLIAVSTAAISLAVVAGFASLLPGGAGVRELVLATILGVTLTSTHGLLAAILIRCVHIVVEAITAVMAWLLLRRLAISPADSHGT